MVVAAELEPGQRTHVRRAACGEDRGEFGLGAARQLEVGRRDTGHATSLSCAESGSDAVLAAVLDQPLRVAGDQTEDRFHWVDPDRAGEQAGVRDEQSPHAVERPEAVHDAPRAASLSLI
jgi:hypothetical protein